MINGHDAPHLVNKSVACLDVASQYGYVGVDDTLVFHEVGDESLSCELRVIDTCFRRVCFVEKVSHVVLGSHEVVFQVMVEGAVCVGFLAIAVVYQPLFQCIHIVDASSFHDVIGYGKAGIFIGVDNLYASLTDHGVAFE